MEGEQFKVTYNVDMVFCIDVTASMRPVINMVKKNALNFYEDVMNNMKKKGKVITNLRIRVIAFRDYIADEEKAMLVTDFFSLPEDSEKFSRCVNGLSAEGGGDEPEDGLEALAYAMKSKWNTEGAKKRHVIVVWTDASTHEIGYGRSSVHYPANMAKDFAELTDWWGGGQEKGLMDEHAKRLILYSPDRAYWKNVSDTWNNVIHFPSVAGEGVEEYDYTQIINTISNSI